MYYFRHLSLICLLLAESHMSGWVSRWSNLRKTTHPTGSMVDHTEIPMVATAVASLLRWASTTSGGYAGSEVSYSRIRNSMSRRQRSLPASIAAKDP